MFEASFTMRVSFRIKQKKRREACITHAKSLKSITHQLAVSFFRFDVFSSSSEKWI